MALGNIDFRALPNSCILAGYPRSGTSLVRLILAHKFGLPTTSVYDEQHLGAEWSQLMGYPFSPDDESAPNQTHNESTHVFFKTHERGETQDIPVKKIVVVRHPRAVFESLQRYYWERNTLKYSMGSLISGRHIWGNWSDWIRSWSASSGDDALWVRYEDMLANMDAAVESLERFLRIKPGRDEIPAFSSLHQSYPTIFRKGIPPAWQLDATHSQVMKSHGSVISMLGYRV